MVSVGSPAPLIHLPGLVPLPLCVCALAVVLSVGTPAPVPAPPLPDLVPLPLCVCACAQAVVVNVGTPAPMRHLPDLVPGVTVPQLLSLQPTALIAGGRL